MSRVWGKSTISSDHEYPINGTWMVPGIFFSTNGYRLVSIEIYTTHKSTQELRLAVYRGGFGVNDTTGATLVEDLFLTNAGSADHQWVTVTSALKPQFNAGEQIWLCFKGNNGTYYVQYDLDPALRGNLSSAGAYDISFYYDPDEFASWPDTIFDGFAPTQIYFNIRINVDISAEVYATTVIAAFTNLTATASLSCSASMAFSSTSVTSSAAFLRCSSSIIFGATGTMQTKAGLSCAASMAFGAYATDAGSARPCWDVSGCHSHAVELTGELTDTPYDRS